MGNWAGGIPTTVVLWLALELNGRVCVFLSEGETLKKREKEMESLITHTSL